MSVSLAPSGGVPPRARPASRFRDVVVHVGGQSRSRSPCNALAVSAMIGVRCSGPRRASPCSRARIAAVASKPSIPGIWQSISTAAYAMSRQGLEHLGAVADHVDGVAELLEHAAGHLLVDGVVLHDGPARGERSPRPQAARGRDRLAALLRQPSRVGHAAAGAGGCGIPRGSSRSARRWRPGGGSAKRACSGRLRSRPAPRPPRARAGPSTSAGRAGRRAWAGVDLMARQEFGTPIHAEHVGPGRRIARSKGRWPPGAGSTSSARGPSAALTHCAPQEASGHSVLSRFVALSSTISARRAALLR